MGGIMGQNITLTVIRGTLTGTEFVLEPNSRYRIGRGKDCDIQLLRDCGPRDISRKHCLLETNEGTVSIRDLGSMHGTYVNGEKIGQRLSGRPAELADHSRFHPRQLKDGDEILVGNTALRVTLDAWVEVLEPVPCSC
jgi:pSer/pThr/pTyr-binding forkhead associated (FHA) protein